MEGLLQMNGLTIKQVLDYEVEELSECESCGEKVPEDYIEWYYEERICRTCLYENGYGE